MKSKGPRSSPPTSPSLFIKAAPKRRHAFTHESSNPSSAPAGVRRTKSDALQARILEFGKRNPLGEVTSRVNLPPRVASVSPVRNRPRPATEVPEHGDQLTQDSILSGHSSRQGASPAEHSSVPAGGHHFLDYTTALHDASASPAGTLQERKLLPLSSPRHTVHQSPKSPWLTARSDVQTSSARHRENISLGKSPLGLSGHRAKSSFDSQNEGFTQQGREWSLVQEKTLSNQVPRKNASYAMPRLPPSSGSALRRRSEMPIGRRPSDSILEEASWSGAPESLVAAGGEPDTLHRSFFAGVPHATSTPYIQNQPIVEDDSVVGIGKYLGHEAHYNDGPSRKLSSPPPEKNLFWDRFCSLPVPDLPVLRPRMTSAPPIRLIPTLPPTATHLHDDSILSSFQTTCGPSSNARREVEQLSDEENKDDGDDADLIPPIMSPKLLRTPTSVLYRAIPDRPTREQGSSDTDIEEDLVPEPGWVRDQPTISHISHVTALTEIKEEPQDDEYHGGGPSHDPRTSSEPRSRAAMSSLASSDDEEPEIKRRSRKSVTFRLPTPPKIRVRIRRQYRKKGDRVALSDLDPKRVWMKILEDPPEIDSGGEDSDDSLLLVQKS
ncbi:hypothetical protein FRC04_005504 [Tulasnella sp. 424]|nr:hypothetical protein FRC04_005504 [Tulasnella sp. 424]KAG8974991.1 hypothetical protein FRC05_006668 [Tulasnella sp. 425]